MTLRLGIALSIAASLTACGSGPEKVTSNTFHIEAASEPVTMSPGQSLLLRIVVLGDGAETATLSSPDLPAFATLSGMTMTLSPGRTDLGDYRITVVAQAGAHSASTQIAVAVRRANSAPTFGAGNALLDGDLFDSSLLFFAPTYCVDASDAEGDPIIADFEVVVGGAPFSNVPTQSARLTQCTPAGTALQCLQCVPLVAPPGHSYAIQVRLRDDLGATSDWDQFPFTIIVGPCGAAPCPAYGLAWDGCHSDSDCLSGACAPWSGGGPVGWHPEFACAPCTGGPCPGAGLPLDACSTDADCIGGSCWLGYGLPGTCNGPVGAECSSRYCRSPSAPVCRVAGPSLLRCGPT
jgi:hypothetical protein